jgi:hypothetical protein
MSEKVKVRSAEDFINDSKKLIDVPVHDPVTDPFYYQAGPSHIDYEIAAKFSMSLGDDNPLYTDLKYPRRTRWGTTLAQPSILTSVRYAICRGAEAWAFYPVAGLVAGFNLEFNDVIRVGDSFETSFYLKDIIEKKGRTGTLLLKPTETKYWNQEKELVAEGGGNHISVVREVSLDEVAKAEGMRGNMIYDRDTYHYSKEEIEKIVNIALNVKKRGATLRYWEDVNVGDKLDPMVKGPLTMEDMFKVWAARAGIERVGTFEVNLKERFNEKFIRTNPVTGWPYEGIEFEHYDFNLCKGRGLPAPFDVGVMRISIISNYVSNWMGDDGFIRKFQGQLRNPNYYGDTTFYEGEITDKYKDNVEGVEYAAVDVRIIATNQLAEVSAPGKATVYLPSHELGPVNLPIPHESEKYELYEQFVKDCAYVRKNPLDLTEDVTEWRKGYDAQKKT